jgi:hypothetical protein
MAISDKIRALIDNAWVDGYPCMLATTGPDGPNVSPKGSMLVFDDQHLPIGNAPRRRRWKISAPTSASS